jgi:hypothetical protein
MITRTAWKTAGFAGAVALAAVLVMPLASTASPPRPVDSSDTGTIVTDTFHSDTNFGNSRSVPGVDGRPFLGNITAQCSFGSSDSSTTLNTTSVHVRSQTPSGSSPFLTSFSERSTDRVITVVTGPFAAYDGVGLPPTYTVICSPGSGNSFLQTMGQAWLQVLP